MVHKNHGSMVYIPQLAIESYETQISKYNIIIHFIHRCHWEKPLTFRQNYAWMYWIQPQIATGKEINWFSFLLYNYRQTLTLVNSYCTLIIIIIDESLGTVGRLMLQGHSRRPKWKWRQKESKLMPTVNYLRVIGCEHDAVNWNESYRKGHRHGKKFMRACLYTYQLK